MVADVKEYEDYEVIFFRPKGEEDIKNPREFQIPPPKKILQEQ